eukprot:11211023-Lingulodinium_polyedra.AAC.1
MPRHATPRHAAPLNRRSSLQNARLRAPSAHGARKRATCEPLRPRTVNSTVSLSNPCETLRANAVES